jgi:hypothetical protein
LQHNGNLAAEVDRYVTRNWSKLGENIGCGGSASSVHDAWMASESHRRNILDPTFNYVGIGVSWKGPGVFFVTTDFVASRDSLVTDIPPSPRSQPPAPWEPPTPWISADVTADGRGDLLHVWSGGVNTWVARGDGTYSLVREGWKPRADYNMGS